MMAFRPAPLALLLGALLFAPAVARAQTPTASERETARGLMAEGRARRARGDQRGALDAFKGADAIMHVPTTGYEVARSQAALGLLVEARDTILRVLRSPARADEPRAFAEARVNAQALDDDLAPRIPSVRVALQNASGDPHLAIDGTPLPAAAALAPIKLDPGHHVITADGARAEVDVAERENKEVPLALPEIATAPEQPAEPAPALAAPAAHPLRPVAIAGFALGGAGLAVGAVTGLMSLQKTSSVKTGCTNNVCPPSSAGDIDAARTTATVSTVAFVAGGVGLAVGVGALLLDHRAPAETTSGARVTPWVGLGSAGVSGAF